MEGLAGLTLLGIAAVVSRRSLRRFQTILAPEILFLGAIGTAVALYQSGVVEFEPLSFRTWAVLGLSILSFLAGSLAAERIVARQRVQRTTSVRSVRTAALVTSVVGGTMAAGALINATGSLLGFSTAALDFGYLYDLWRQGSGTSLYLLNAVAVGINVTGLLCAGPGFKRLRWLFAFLLLVNIAALAISPVKINLARGCFLGVITAALVFGKGRRVAVFAVLGFLAFFVWHTDVRSPYYEYDYGNYQARGIVNLPDELNFLGAPFTYATGGLAGLNRYVDQDMPEPALGVHSFRFLFSGLARLGAELDMPDQNKEFVRVPFRINVYTAFRSSVDDFWWWGLSIWAVYGLLSKIVFLWVRNGKLEWVFVYGVLGFCCVMVFFSNHFAYLATFILLAWSVLFGRLVYRPVYAPGLSPAATRASRRAS